MKENKEFGNRRHCMTTYLYPQNLKATANL